MVFRDDLHIHASFYRDDPRRSAAGPRVVDQLRAAEAVGAGRIGILEHCNASPRHPFRSLQELRAEYESLGLDPERRFRGVEADLLPGGFDSCGASGRRMLALDYVIGSVHLSPAVVPDFAAYLGEEFTRIMQALLENPGVDVIGHPFVSGERYQRSGAIGHWDFGLVPPQWLSEIVGTARKMHKALEINYPDLEDPAYLAFLRMMKDAEVLFTLGSDAHLPDRCVRIREVHALAESIGFDARNQWLPTGAEKRR